MKTIRQKANQSSIATHRRTQILSSNHHHYLILFIFSIQNNFYSSVTFLFTQTTTTATAFSEYPLPIINYFQSSTTLFYTHQKNEVAPSDTKHCTTTTHHHKRATSFIHNTRPYDTLQKIRYKQKNTIKLSIYITKHQLLPI